MIYDLKVQRVFDCAPEDVFDAFTDPGAQKEWYQLDLYRAATMGWSVVLRSFSLHYSAECVEG
jgi:uncharacterized protein YndB with AHSA1/START domain